MKTSWSLTAAVSDARRRASCFVASRRGNVAMLFALSMPAMIMMTFAGVDIHRLSTVRSNLQDAQDAATLAAARSQYTEDIDIRRVGLAALKANLAAYSDVVLNEGSTTFMLNEEGVVVSDAHVTVETLVANIVMPHTGRFFDDRYPINTHSEVLRSNYRIEVALVIDNTGSMLEEGRLPAAQAAAINLVDRLEAAASRSVEDEAVKISLVPFSMTVRPSEGFAARASDAGAQSAGWLSRATNHTGSSGTYGLFANGQNRFALLDAMRIGWAGCVEGRPYPFDTNDTPPTAANQATMFVPYFSPDTPDEEDYRNDSGWQNYSYDNDYLNDWQASSEGRFTNASTRAAQFMTRLKDERRYINTRIDRTISASSYGPNQGCRLEPVTRLTEDFDSIRDSIDDMVATGNTNIPGGLVWGWHTLSPNAPFRDGRPYDTDRLQKIIILLTDGDNVNSEYGNPNNSTYAGAGLIWQNRLGVGAASNGTSRRNAMDDRLEELCGNLRTREVMVYTVGVKVSDRTEGLLAACATEADMFYPVTSTGGIEAAFDRIAGAIENLRISR